MTAASTNENSIKDSRPLYLMVGELSVSPCDHETFARYKLWVARKHTAGKIDSYTSGSVCIEHWDDTAESSFPHLLNPCECGTYLPMQVEPGPMLSSSISLLEELTQLKKHYDDMEPGFCALMDALFEMAELSIEKNIVLEIR